MDLERFERRAPRIDRADARECGCSEQTHCAGRRMDPFVARQLPLDERVRRVAEEVAQICTAMDETALGDCFVELFGLPRDCRMFERFCAAYRANDARRPGSEGKILVKVRTVAALLEGFPTCRSRLKAAILDE